ncbi:ABC transporter substrate-binding protein [Vibrio sp. SCSIO 43137]|uniref:ABC transporter substrate-binding protein n=1 Tax=Vibrio sp. SCSIO 43137 TaxID=3021011 RepID=UPI0023073CC6|nr:ABC transporter substrate-binding protein [Vibrio sp. SCSIO 43137]WCE28837.1 ABC transporter substrate-binding protein [Vibrio sp. SCSIO 43137]
MADKLPPEKHLSGLEYELIGRNEIYNYRSLPSYSEAPFLKQLVTAGKLPPLEKRLPKEPLVFKTAAMSDGVGEYGGVFRHVIGGRPQGFNWLAGQTQGWGGINMALQECLVRQGPRWQIKPAGQTGPLPNLAKSWEWNQDNTQLTMHLIEGAKWSDGDTFDSDDIKFWWEDNVEDANVASFMRAGTLGEGTKLDVVDAYTIRFTFAEQKNESIVENFAFLQGCPGPSHVLKKYHPKYNSEATYSSYSAAMPADALPIPVMGAWVPVLHKPDELVILRRNPYYWKVDEKGQQLPYLNELHFKLSTWDDRTTQAIAGTGDFSNMENPGNFVEAVKQSRTPDSPIEVKFGPRIQGWRVNLNFSNIGIKDDIDSELRRLFRNKDFRIAFSHALDRKSIGQSVVRGPFTYPYTGGFLSGSPYFDYSSTVYQPYDIKKAKKLLDSLGLKDIDGNGIRNMPKTGEDLVIDLVFISSRNDARKQVDAMTSQLADVGIRLLPKGLDESSFERIRAGGSANALFQRTNFVRPTREVCDQLPVSEKCPYYHQANNGERNLMPFEKELIERYNTFVSSSDANVKLKAILDMQTIITENAYVIGTVQAPGALLVNKRVKNAHPGTPTFMFEWAEDGIIRERLWVAKEEQQTELLPGVIAEY